jgi:hypothetical protein
MVKLRNICIPIIFPEYSYYSFFHHDYSAAYKKPEAVPQVGILPGIGPISGVALLIPVTPKRDACINGWVQNNTASVRFKCVFQSFPLGYLL